MTGPGLPLTTGEGGATLGENVNWLLAECSRLREQLDAARQALEAILSTGAGEWNLLEVHRIARAALLTEGLPARAALGVEGPQPDQGSAPTENVGRARDEEPS